MAFARPGYQPPQKPPVQRHRHEHIQHVPITPEPKIATLKDLRKVRKVLSEKIEHALSLKGDISSVHEQLRSIGDAFDTLSQVLVDELDYIRGDVARTKVDMVDQMTTLAKALQDFSPEIGSIRHTANASHAAAEGAHKSGQKLKQWSESGFRRLNEAMSVQQQALSVLDDQMLSMQDKIQQFGGDLTTWRQESAQRSIEYEKLRHDLSMVKADHEGLIQDHRQQVHVMQATASNYEMAMADRETRAAMQLQDYARAEADIHELRAICDARISALEKAWRRDMPRAGGSQAAEGRVKDLEFELGQLKRQIAEQGEALRDMQRQVTKAADRPLAQSRADQLQLQDMVAKAVHDYMMRNQPKVQVQASVVKSRGASMMDASKRGGTPLKATDILAEGDESNMLSSPGVVSSALERVMIASQNRVGRMRQESEMRHAALTRAVEEIDERIRTSTA